MCLNCRRAQHSHTLATALAAHQSSPSSVLRTAGFVMQSTALPLERRSHDSAGHQYALPDPDRDQHRHPCDQGATLSKRVCPTPGCPTLVSEGLCAECKRAKDKARGTRQERGYGAEHVAIRAALLPEAYGTRCTHCSDYMWPHQELHLDHTEDRTAYRGIVHASCNASEGARRGNAARGGG